MFSFILYRIILTLANHKPLEIREAVLDLDGVALDERQLQLVH